MIRPFPYPYPSLQPGPGPSLPTEPSKKENRQQFWQKVGQKYDRAGGAAGIGSTIDSLVNLVRPNPNPQVSNLNPAGDNSGMQMRLATSPQEPKNKIPVAVWVVGGLVVLGLGAWALGAFKSTPQPETTAG